MSLEGVTTVVSAASTSIGSEVEFPSGIDEDTVARERCARTGRAAERVVGRAKRLICWNDRFIMRYR
jgi:hypothetical protein